jgi:hypothetical protein
MDSGPKLDNPLFRSRKPLARMLRRSLLAHQSGNHFLANGARTMIAYIEELIGDDVIGDVRKIVRFGDSGDEGTTHVRRN